MFNRNSFLAALLSAGLLGSTVAVFFIATTMIPLLTVPRENLPSFGMMCFYVGYVSVLAFSHKLLYLAGESLGMQSLDLNTMPYQFVGGFIPFMFVWMLGGLYSPASMMSTAWACALIGSTVSALTLAYYVYVRKSSGRPLEFY